MTVREDLIPMWPVFGLRLRTPRLELKVCADDDLADLVEVVRSGVHREGDMPFAEPWTIAPESDLGPNMLRVYWQWRAETNREAWRLPFVVRHEEHIVGQQEIAASRFDVTRTIVTGSWLGRTRHGQGIGTEMRAAVLLFAFDHLGADRAESSAFLDNPASLRVSEKLGYRRDGVCVVARQNLREVQQRMFVTPTTLVRPGWTLQVEGLDACRGFLGSGE